MLLRRKSCPKSIMQRPSSFIGEWTPYNSHQIRNKKYPSDFLHKLLDLNYLQFFHHRQQISVLVLCTNHEQISLVIYNVVTILLSYDWWVYINTVQVFWVAVNKHGPRPHLLGFQSILVSFIPLSSVSCNWLRRRPTKTFIPF